MNDLPHRTLWVQTKHNIVYGAVLSMEHSAESDTWVVLVDTAQWLDGEHYADCTLRHGEGHQSPTWRGSFHVLEHIIDPEQGLFYTNGLFHPADANVQTLFDEVRDGGCVGEQRREFIGGPRCT